MGILRAIPDPLPMAPVVSTACVLGRPLAFPGSLSLCLGLSLFSLSLSFCLLSLFFSLPISQSFPPSFFLPLYLPLYLSPRSKSPLLSLLLPLSFYLSLKHTLSPSKFLSPSPSISISPSSLLLCSPLLSSYHSHPLREDSLLRVWQAPRARESDEADEVTGRVEPCS